ncbi:hypothetical protein LTS07_008451 [Exophiala sideris]|uniref:DUF1275 domain protein n=1 Tax=Exophiala sideris TaxID=1016849 RepID=A0ABR0J1Y6_9EURO|nr:hypothetical protein LTS07_008451 [Exophiala sideris]KAK5030698.1 hypothetical protein LTR13_008052 [Exophiala sideris]KAK5054238.1 hypothetical protein LTR69_008853 [Exophiala sideris]KAK5179640.1 hypothetical protein LTR44_007808 [Eurotiomycetes sp. CCFEE 6388]
MASTVGYGTAGRDSNHDNSTQGAADSENHPLLGGGKAKSTSSFTEYMKDDIDRKWADLLLLLSYIITGLLDSSAVFIWGSFVSMQTGNTVYLGLGLVEPTKGTRWIKFFSPKRRWVLLTSFFMQLLLIVVAAVIVMIDTGKGGDLRWEVLVPLALVAFQSSGQAVTSRALQYNALTSVVLTSIYCDLWSDPLLMAGLTQNAERNRRAAAPLLLLAGAIFGGLWAHSPIGLAGALWTAAGLKIVIMGAFFLWKAEKPAPRT